jgi:hypothetical protein
MKGKGITLTSFDIIKQKCEPVLIKFWDNKFETAIQCNNYIKVGTW